MLGIAYAASIGGVATLIGTPTNLILSQVYESQFPEHTPIGFASWFVMALSASFAFMLPVATPPNVIVFASG